MTWLELVHEVAYEHGVSVTDVEADSLLWNETGFPGFFHGEPVNTCACQLREAFCRRGFRRLRPLHWYRGSE